MRSYTKGLRLLSQPEAILDVYFNICQSYSQQCVTHHHKNQWHTLIGICSHTRETAVGCEWADVMWTRLDGLAFVNLK
jgi:hypothetical protein